MMVPSRNLVGYISGNFRMAATKLDEPVFKAGETRGKQRPQREIGGHRLAHMYIEQFSHLVAARLLGRRSP